MAGGGQQRAGDGWRGRGDPPSNSTASFKTGLPEGGPFFISNYLSEVGNPLANYTYFFQNKIYFFFILKIIK